MESEKKFISVITPVFNEESNIFDCYEKVQLIFKEELAQYEYEHIFCDNGSTDNTVNALREISQKDKNIKVIINSRNFGILRSTFNGLMNASGDAVVVLLAADLQDPPEAIIEFVKKWEEGYEVVFGVRKVRRENIIMRMIRNFYYHIVRKFSYISIPFHANAFQLIDKKVLQALKQFDDYYPSIRGMIASCGFKSIGVDLEWRKRKKGMSKNTFYHLFDEGLNDLISFSFLPMRVAIIAGLFISFASIVYAIFSLITVLFFNGGNAPSGIPTLIVALFFLSGIQLVFLGILGEYICAIHFQVRKRPLVIERERINFDK
ncbi:MAG: glycosyltransferase family 2 protein [Candidatus Aceula meridiana]|nr:glycosyltransferase family 2 protein [Candidatus Aceula meridiana]